MKVPTFDGTILELTEEQLQLYWDREYPTTDHLNLDPEIVNRRKLTMALGFAGLCRLHAYITDSFADYSTVFYTEKVGNC